MNALIVPQWPLPKGVAACSSTRIGGVSLPPYDSLNLARIAAITRSMLKRTASVCLRRAICLRNLSGLNRFTVKMC